MKIIISPSVLWIFKVGFLNEHILSPYTNSNMFLDKIITIIWGRFIDPLGRPTVTAGRDHCFCTCPPSVHFSKSSKIKQSENNVRYRRDYGSGRVDHWCHLSCNNVRQFKFQGLGNIWSFSCCCQPIFLQRLLRLLVGYHLL